MAAWSLKEPWKNSKQSTDAVDEILVVMKYLRPPLVLGLWENEFPETIHFRILLRLLLDATLSNCYFLAIYSY